MNKLIYLAIPYSWNPEIAYDIANKVSATLMKQGYIVFSPISHSHPIANNLDESLRKDHEFWMKQDLPILAKCDQLWIVNIKGVDIDSKKLISESRGVQAEINFAKKTNKEIIYIDSYYLDDSQYFEKNFKKDMFDLFIQQGKVIKEAYSNPNKETKKDQGLRYNEGKPKWSLVDFDSLEGIVKVLEHGCKKYERDNWKKGMPVSEVLESLLRHVFALMRGEEKDKESGLPHIWHVQTNAMFVDYITRNKPEFNDIKNN